MRCPKCGYISYDHLEECLKCKKNIKAATENINGSIYHVAAPTFLHIPSDNHEEYEESGDIIAEDLQTDGEEYIDDELAILVDSPDAEFDDDDAPEITIGDEMDVELGDDGDSELGFEVEEAEEDGIEIDLSQFEAAPSPDMISEEDEESAEPDAFGGLDMPEELADISDLDPPGLESQTNVEAAQEEPELSLDDLDFDLGLNGLDDIGSGPDQEQVMSLDEIDFTDTLAETQPLRSASDRGVSMDDDLDFELDLGDLSIDKEL